MEQSNLPKIPGSIKKQVDRRQFLKLAGAAAITAAVGTSIAKVIGSKRDTVLAAGTRPEIAKNQWAMVIDLRLCDGCGHCTTGCQKMHYLPREQEFIKIHTLHGGSGQKYYLPRLCMQCENPPCVKVCPVKATYQEPDGVTLIDQTRCIGCRMCMAACPYQARYFNWKDPPVVPPNTMPPTPEWPVPQVRSTVGKCVFCVHNLREGKLPACIISCPMEAIYVGDFNSDIATNGVKAISLSRLIKDNDAYRLKEELMTQPRVYYIAGHGQHLEF